MAEFYVRLQAAILVEPLAWIPSCKNWSQVVEPYTWVARLDDNEEPSAKEDVIANCTSQNVEDYFREAPTTCRYVNLNSTREAFIAAEDENKPTFLRHCKVLTNAFVQRAQILAERVVS